MLTPLASPPQVIARMQNAMRINVEKHYTHHNGGLRILSGVIESPCNTYAEGAAIVNGMMTDAHPLQTIDPRIEWDEDFEEGNGWQYLDWSFTVTN